MRGDEVVETQDTRLRLQAIVDFLKENIGVGGVLFLATCTTSLAALMLRSRTEPSHVRPSSSVVRLPLLDLVVISIAATDPPKALV